MPLYEYECTTCHKHTEKIQKFSDPEITVCPHCGGHLERVISAPADQLQRGRLVRRRLRQRQTQVLERWQRLRIKRRRIEVRRFEIHRFEIWRLQVR